MTATDELRRLLDERGVEWRGGLPTETIIREPIDVLYVERSDGRMHVYFRSYLTPEQAVEATLGGDNSDTIKRLMELQGGHYSWPMLYEAVTGDPFDYDCPPSKSEEVFIEKLISIVGGRKVVDA